MNSKIQLKAETVTMGDLIVAITDAALEIAQDEDMAYQIAGLVFMRLLAVCDPERPIICWLAAPARFTKCSHPAPLSDEEKVSGAKAD
jgi:hypothetical protein